ncbi:MAG TPA: LuxR C-terminal-related transcriptional regulator [Polyangiaceae bacterium]|jgi:DNA-binding CsgD family transcriptional regulator/catechol 2,3-dioxygenase-like lactoylglutathione lyase family enzyme|nr:LuxR C-terminal-related transcriptional regulator [Polyangiaceae bacterium]
MRSARGRPPHPDVLTPAEWRVVHFVRHGLSNRQIAMRFGVSLDAIKYHVENIVTKLGLEGRARLKHWRGAPKDSALGRRKAAMTAPSALGPIGQISRSVKNIEESIDWYKNKLGLTHLYTYGKLSFFDCAGTRLFLEESAQPSSESVLYLRVPDINASYDALQARGVAFTSAPHSIHRHEDGMEEWMAFFNDLEGRALAIMSQVKPVNA